MNEKRGDRSLERAMGAYPIDEFGAFGWLRFSRGNSAEALSSPHARRRPLVDRNLESRQAKLA